MTTRGIFRKRSPPVAGATRPFALTARNGRVRQGVSPARAGPRVQPRRREYTGASPSSLFSARALADGRRSLLPCSRLCALHRRQPKRQKISMGTPCGEARLAAVSASFSPFRFVVRQLRREEARRAGRVRKADCPASKSHLSCGYCLSRQSRVSRTSCALQVLFRQRSNLLNQLPDFLIDNPILEKLARILLVTMSSTSPERRQNVLPSQWISPSGHRATSVQGGSQTRLPTLSLQSGSERSSAGAGRSAADKHT